MTTDIFGIILSCLNDARRQGWDRSQLTIRCGTSVMQHIEDQYAKLAIPEPSLTLTPGRAWGCPFDADISLSSNQIVVVSRAGEVLGGAYVAV